MGQGMGIIDIPRNNPTTPVEIKVLTFLTTVNQLKCIFSHSIVVQTIIETKYQRVILVQSYLDE